jgi:hypothetical protein
MKKTTVPPALGMFLNTAKEPRRPSDKQLVREHAKSQKRHATQEWVAGRMNTSEHSAIHARADHVLAGRAPRQFKGKNGDRKMRGYDAGL